MQAHKIIDMLQTYKVFDQMLKQKKNIPFSMVNKENIKKRKRKAFKGEKNENNSNCCGVSRWKNNYS